MSRVISILDYIPPVLADAEEQKQIFKALNPEINMLWAEIERAQNNQFISSSDEYGVARRENMLSIKPKNTETLDDRKFRLLSREIEKLPYTYRVLKNKLKALCGENGYTLNIDYENEIVDIKIELTSRKSFDEVELMTEKMIPLNMVINISLLYNQNSLLKKYTHKQLSAYKHSQLRNEVINNV
ncbi:MULTISPECIES: putative phage tail protein [Clostridium]|uniref:Phage protein n=3 Tax=Clostridium TaxID=1485 RepID=A0ABY6SU09_9CLOT|nr:MULTISPECIES: putative phage tail protein [Clostridium]CAI3542765.1 putative Mu-like phage tail protein [Clostridium neonatale]MDU4479641.1 putative phage tail protein [Clostridium sp.]CAI3575999.1 putative Mu-like phage tail protein [Clostridium neonatale]CAI3721693.1 putative Mu-like phage tail protein [Clostridium neonatale]VDG71728.1 phage protein [Clostridium carnis]